MTRRQGCPPLGEAADGLAKVGVEVTARATVLARVRAQDEALLTALDTAEAVVRSPGQAGLPAALEELGCRLRAHAAVSEKLLLERLGGGPGRREGPLAELEAEHDGLRCLFASGLERRAGPAALAQLAMRLREHLAHERAVLRRMGPIPGERLASTPVWLADELYELSGGWVESWPEKWLG